MKKTLFFIGVFSLIFFASCAVSEVHYVHMNPHATVIVYSQKVEDSTYVIAVSKPDTSDFFPLGYVESLLALDTTQVYVEIGIGNGFIADSFLYTCTHVVEEVAGSRYHWDVARVPSSSYEDSGDIYIPHFHVSDIPPYPQVVMTVVGYHPNSHAGFLIGGIWYQYLPQDSLELAKYGPVLYMTPIPRKYLNFDFGGLSGSPAIDTDGNVFGVLSAVFYMVDDKGRERGFFAVSPLYLLPP